MLIYQCFGILFVCLQYILFPLASTTSLITTSVQISVLPPNDANPKSKSFFDPSQQISGGLLSVNMSGYAPIPKSGMISLSLPIGTHRVSLYHPYFLFEDLTIQLKPNSHIKVFSQPFQVHGSSRGPLLFTTNEIHWKAQSFRVYHEIDEGFQLFGLFRSPMMLMALFSLFMVYAMPKLASQIEQETQANGGADPQLIAQKNELIKNFEELR